MKKTNQGTLSNSALSIKTRDGKKINIPFEGSLGLLALGDVGLLLWRKTKEKILSSSKKES